MKNNDELLKKIALDRYAVLSPWLTKMDDHSTSDYTFCVQASIKTYKNHNGVEVQYSATTIARWLTMYRKDSFDGLIPKRRSDLGGSRKLDDDLRQQIRHYRSEFPKLSATMIYQKLIETEQIEPNQISLSTVNRFVNTLKVEAKENQGDEFRRYEKAHINEVWYADSCHAFYIEVDGKKKKLYIIGSIDDASRMIVGVDVFFQDDFKSVMCVMQAAIKKYGRPKLMSFDNGSSYKNKQMELLAARIAVNIHYCAPYTLTSKAKIERWFRTLRSQWMAKLNPKDFKNIEQIRKSLGEYVNQYNNHAHSGIGGKTPNQRFFEEPNEIRRLSTTQLKSSFLLEYTRKVSKDNVVVLEGKEYEVDYAYAQQNITLRCEPNLSKVYIAGDGNEWIEIALLDKEVNSNIQRNKVQLR